MVSNEGRAIGFTEGDSVFVETKDRTFYRDGSIVDTAPVWLRDDPLIVAAPDLRKFAERPADRHSAVLRRVSLYREVRVQTSPWVDLTAGGPLPTVATDFGPLTTADLRALMIAGERCIATDRDRMLGDPEGFDHEAYEQMHAAHARLSLMLRGPAAGTDAKHPPIRYAAAERIEAGQLVYTRDTAPGESLTVRDGHVPVWPLTRDGEKTLDRTPVGVAIDDYRPGDVVVPEPIGQVQL